MDIKLKPCPFCGGEAELRRSTHPKLLTEGAWVECRECTAMSRIFSIESCEKTSDDCYQPVIDAWNNRPKKIFNINDGVLVRLSNDGKLIYARKKWEMNNDKEISWSKAVDNNGYSRFQLCELMAIYGDEMYARSDPPFDTNIILED